MHSSLAFVCFALIFTSLDGVHSATVTFTNRCPYTVWPANLNGDQRPQLSRTGFELAQGATESLDVPSTFSGLFWPRTHCSTDPSGRFSCLTGDCGSGQVECQGKGGAPPLTQIEFTFNQNGGQDTFDISLVNGFSVPVSVAPQGGSGVKCNSISCSGVNGVCPNELKLNGPNNEVIACKSACDEFKEPQYCCTGEFAIRGNCKPSSFSTIFKNQCPQAYSYAHDDESSTFTCNTGINYAITFCP